MVPLAHPIPYCGQRVRAHNCYHGAACAYSKIVSLRLDGGNSSVSKFNTRGLSNAPKVLRWEVVR